MAAERNDEEIAAALHGLSAGHHDSTAEHAGGVHGEQAGVPPAERTAPPQGSKRPAAPPARPAAPLPPRPEPRAALRTPAPAAPRSSSSGRPSAPARPAVPEQTSAYDQEVFDDGDETVLSDAPATPLDYRGPRTAPQRPRKPPVFKTLGFRRTVIPVLLTTGVMMLVMFAARWVIDEEAPLAHLPAWTGIMLVVTGVALVALSILNMLLVRSDLAKRKGKA